MNCVIAIPTATAGPSGARQPRRTVPKAELIRAIKARCRDCAENATVIRQCDGHFQGYDCALWLYRPGHKPRKRDAMGQLLPEFRKRAVWAAIRAECRFCVNGHDPGLVCSSPECSLHRFRRGRSGYRRDFNEFADSRQEGVHVDDDHGAERVTPRGDPAHFSDRVPCGTFGGC